MSKIAILSDIHANADALQQVLAVCDAVGVDKYTSLGDIVGYNAEPQLCLQMVNALNPIAMVRGNHDDYTAMDDDEMEGFNPNAKKAILWTRSQISEEERRWVGGMPVRVTVPGMPMTKICRSIRPSPSLPPPAAFPVPSSLRRQGRLPRAASCP